MGVAKSADAVAADLRPLAGAIGRSWVAELVRALRSDEREIIGGWPGTLAEARMRIRLACRTQLDAPRLDELARAANLAARLAWLEVSKADPES